jgi:phthiodiolone/phenolphthiodiolone dimycocerosates ketoreductase
MSRQGIRLGLHIPAKPPLSNVKMLTRLCRVVGIDTAMVWDHFQDFVPQSMWHEGTTWMARDQTHFHEHYEYQVLLGHLAGIAGNMRLGVGVTEPLRRHPVLIAQAMMTLSHMTKRPPILGIGAGERENTEPYGIPLEKPVSKLEEALQIIRKCYTSRGPFDFDGDHFQLKNAIMDLNPDHGKVPSIWIAAHGPRMLRLTGQYGNGWYPVGPMTPEEYGDSLSTIRRHAQDAGRDPATIAPSLAIQLIMAPTDEEAWEILEHPLIRLAALTYPATVFEKHGLKHPLGDGFRGVVEFVPEEIPTDQVHAALEQIPQEFLEQTMIWGSADTVAEQIRALGQAGLRHVVVTPTSVVKSERILRYLPRGLFRLRRLLQ